MHFSDIKPIIITKKTIMYIRYVIENFDINKFDVSTSENVGFHLSYMYSYDGINYSNPVAKEYFIIDSDYKNIYIAVLFEPENPNLADKADTLFVDKNVDSTIQQIQLDSVKYDSTTSFQLDKPDDVRFLIFDNIINRYPKWNFYDGQEVTIKRWLDQCDAINEMYGHTCIYFKTESVDNGTSYTLANHAIRNVVAIKKIKLNIPNNELPQDRSAYTDWDFMLPDEFIVHVINRKFKQAFGEDKVPLSKDYLYLPITGKLYRVNSVQAKNGFMNRIGWWECFLTKYEEDECVVMSDELKEAMRDSSQDEDMDFLQQSLEAIDSTIEDKPDIFDELEDLKNEINYSADKINAETINEKKEATQWFTNKDYDSTWYISLKETEHQREMINKRLQIVNVNPDNNAFPVTMYDCNTVIEGNVGLVYDLKDYISVNKQSTMLQNINDHLQFSFNYVMMGLSTNEIFRFVDVNGTSVFSVHQDRKKILLDYEYGGIHVQLKPDYTFEKTEMYNITLQLSKQQLSIIIFKLDNKQKTYAHQDIVAVGVISDTQINFAKLLMYGGKMLVNDVYVYINDKVVLKDNVNPLLIMNNY